MVWTRQDIPSQAGRLAVVTGANAGIGFETALALAIAGAEVVVAARDPSRGEAAVRRILARYPQGGVRLETLDLASLADVRAFAARLADRYDRLDVLINNAGVMAPPQRQTTQDGFELQFGVNYLAHFALTARLTPLLRQAESARVVNVSSLAHRAGTIAFDDLQSARQYRAWQAYAQSKLAMLMFAIELQRRSEAAGWGLIGVAAHPGYARTELINNGLGPESLTARLERLVGPLASQSAADGASPILFAATSPEAIGAGYYGPSGVMEMRGSPKPAKLAAAALDRDAGARLWAVSEQLTGASFASAP